VTSSLTKLLSSYLDYLDWKRINRSFTSIDIFRVVVDSCLSPPVQFLWIARASATDSSAPSASLPSWDAISMPAKIFPAPATLSS